MIQVSINAVSQDADQQSFRRSTISWNVGRFSLLEQIKCYNNSNIQSFTNLYAVWLDRRMESEYCSLVIKWILVVLYST